MHVPLRLLIPLIRYPDPLPKQSERQFQKVLRAIIGAALEPSTFRLAFTVPPGAMDCERTAVRTKSRAPTVKEPPQQAHLTQSA
jgi:hypothetical protein